MRGVKLEYIYNTNERKPVKETNKQAQVKTLKIVPNGI